MTLLYMYFETKDNKKYKSIQPNKLGYRFDNRYIINYDKEKKTFEINNNINFVQIYNEAIVNISCIVGKNGSGKTTFIELLLSNIVWGISDCKMICIYYQINSSGEVEFFLHHFKNSLKENGFKLLYNGEEKQFIDEHHSSYNKSLNYTTYTSIMPKNTKFIYHSLSPFDKIFYSIGQTLKENKYTTSHYIKSMNYIGTQSFFKDDVSHEIETISNLITLFTNDFGRKPFEESLGYKFSALKINFDIDDYITIDTIDNYINTIEDTLSRYSKIDTYTLLREFNNLKQDIKKVFFQDIVDFFCYEIKDGKDLLFYIFIHNIDFQKLFYVTNLNKFLELIDFSNIIHESGEVNKDLLKENIKDLNVNKYNSSLFKDSSFFNNMLKNIEVLDSIVKLSNISLEILKN